MVPVLEAVPNFSAGREPVLVERLARAASELGADVLDTTTDPDHNRAVLTLLGSPSVIEETAVALARIAVDSIDLTGHRGVHPRVGSLDVLPLVPLIGVSMERAREIAHRVGERLAREVGVPVYFYAEASDPPGRGLAEIRAGGFESLVSGFPPERAPDLIPEGWTHPGLHPTAGAVCVGARPVLLAWNVEVEGLTLEELAELAKDLRERDGGFEGLRVLALPLDSRGRMQVSMNLEDVRNRKPFEVFRALEDQVRSAGGAVLGTEVIGLLPDELVFGAAADRLALLDRDPSRVLSSRLVEHLVGRLGHEIENLAGVVEASGTATPPEVREAVQRLRDGTT